MAGSLLIILSCLFWAMDTLIRYPLVGRGIDPVVIVFYEHVILSLLVSSSLLSSFRNLGEIKLADLFSFVVVGGVGSALATIAFTQSFQYLNPSLVILLQKFQPIVVIAFSGLILKEEVQPSFLFWAAICLLGGLLISSPDVVRFYELIRTSPATVTSDVALKGYGLVAASVIGWGTSTVFGKRLTLMGFETKKIMAGRFLAGLIFILPFMQWNHSLILPQGEDYLRILIMVLISGALAMWFYYQGLKRISARTAAIAEMFFPFLAIVVNWFFLGKQLTDLQLFGGVLLIFGSFVIQLKKY